MSHVHFQSNTSSIFSYIITCSYSNILLPFSVHLKDVVNVSLLISISVHIFEYTQETGRMSVLSMAATNDLLSLLTSNHTCSHMPSKLETKYGNLFTTYTSYSQHIHIYIVHTCTWLCTCMYYVYVYIQYMCTYMYISSSSVMNHKRSMDQLELVIYFALYNLNTYSVSRPFIYSNCIRT